ncbi:HAD family phosphatase [Candidatus Woesearchaeota archaeon]|nr:HAD family phosphatase [Candidatus Woesearchaeota archaeon]
MTIKLIIFDMSDVCSNSEDPPFIEKLAKKYNINPETLENRFNETIAIAEVDKISGTEAWERLIKEFNLKENPEELIRNDMESKEFYPEMLELTNNLRKKIPTVCFTNYNKDHWDKVHDKVKDYFDEVFVSYQLKTRKPSQEGFKIIMKKYDVKPEETIFIDDSIKNVEQAAEIGIKAIQFKNKEQLLEELEGVGVKL